MKILSGPGWGELLTLLRTFCTLSFLLLFVELKGVAVAADYHPACGVGNVLWCLACQKSDGLADGSMVAAWTVICA
jgi:hypothetical protein